MRNINKITNIFDLYYTDKITREERLTMLKNTISIEDFNEAISLLEDTKSLEDVQNVILTGWLLNCFNPSNEEPLRKLLLLNFHDSHEDIVDLFQTMWNNSAKNIPILLKTIDNIPEYLEPEDFKHPYIRKIIYAIGAQPQPESLLALEKLASETNDIKIKEYISEETFVKIMKMIKVSDNKMGKYNMKLYRNDKIWMYKIENISDVDINFKDCDILLDRSFFINNKYIKYVIIKNNTGV